MDKQQVINELTQWAKEEHDKPTLLEFVLRGLPLLLERKLHRHEQSTVHRWFALHGCDWFSLYTSGYTTELVTPTKRLIDVYNNL